MIEVRELHEMAELERVDTLFDDIWHFAPAAPPITIELMRALSHAGGYVAGAFANGDLIGASVGFLAADRALHSHVTGATRPGVGYQLKLHQRRWAMERGLERITWTYDPLVRRNAHFNLAKLGARPLEYLPCFYGVLGDAINQGDESDRLLASWPLAAPHVAALAQGEPYDRPVASDAVVALADEGGRPVATPVGGAARTVLVAVPEDIEGLRRADPGAGKAWRHAVRDVLGGLMAEGHAVTGFSGKRYYVVERA
ncbi:GNAT family N-acetyltransferase [Nonomuraea sp. PA05]|uniref:GNAT family N-acetyltransferase n=1 Tax=Nonomuraea sp. PA05 TaxID=2604466 RepID=UPI0011D73F4C|nr:GNAT family N-acetyltransferase [Nonomuraea sp. PA05]TYB65298.1 GNAT family N-acetyltransferase [Nonomuraea sp. PA05]